jgi:hypothetical protein
MGKLLQLIAKLFGKNAISKTLGTRTNVIKLPGNEQKRLIKDELNIEAASDLAAQKVLKEAEDLIAEIPKMNDQEILTLTGNLQRLDNKLNPPSAEVLDLTTKKPITGEGLEQLAARDGLPADVSPDSPIGKVMQGAQRLRKEKDELDKMLKDPVKQLEQEMQNPYRAGGALDPKMGIVRTAARQVLQKLAREGKINIEDPREAKAIIEGYQGGVDPIEVFRKTFGQDALGDLANLGDELLEIDNRGGSFKELKKILDDEGFFDLQQPKSPAQGMTDEELMKRIKSEDPEEFATGGRVGFDDGGILSLEEAKKLNPGMFVDTTTYNPIPENAPNMAADEIAKVIMGTLGMDDDMSSRTFVFEEYVMPKRKELMENFGLTMKEADDLIREGMAKYRTNKAIGGRVGFQKGTSKIFDQLEMDVPHPYGHRVNYQIGGPAYDATDPIYGSSAITVTPDTIMGPQGNQIQAQTGVNPALQRSQNPFKNLDYNTLVDQNTTKRDTETQNRIDVMNLKNLSQGMNLNRGKGLFGTGIQTMFHGTSPESAQNIKAKGFQPSAPKGGFNTTWADAFQKGAKTFVSNPNVANTYGSTKIPIATSAGNLTSPIGGGITKSSVALGPERVLTPGQATKGMNLIEKAKQYSNSPTAKKLLAGKTLGNVAKTALGRANLPLTVGTTAFDIGMQLPAVQKYGTKLGEGLYDLLNPSSAEADQLSAMPQGSPGQLNPTMANVAGPSRDEIIQRILKNIEPTFDSSQYSPLDLDYLKSLSPSEIKDELDAVYLEGRRFRDADYSSGRIGGGRSFF